MKSFTIPLQICYFSSPDFMLLFVKKIKDRGPAKFINFSFCGVLLGLLIQELELETKDHRKLFLVDVQDLTA